MERRVLVTGLDGFTGRHLLPVLEARGFVVHGLVAPRGEDAPGRAPTEALTRLQHAGRVHVADLNDAPRLHEVVAAVRPESVIHLAGLASPAHHDGAGLYLTNLVGTRHLLAALAALPLAPRTVLLVSSASVYGSVEQGVFDEHHATAPSNDYAVSKLAMEAMARLWTARLPIVVVRPFNYTGRGQSEAFVLAKILGHCQRREPVLELGNIEVERDFNDVRRVVEAYARLLDASAVAGRTFNVCSGRAVSLRALLEMAVTLTGHRPEVRINPALLRPNDPPRIVGTQAALEAVIGPIPAIPLIETLAWMR